MAQVNPAELPHELFNIKIVTQMSEFDGPLN